MSDFKPDYIPLHEWMTIPQFDNLSLYEMTLPGTHNAGCDWQASYAPTVKNWVACQDISFYSQLYRGSRVLDVRLSYRGSAQGFNRFRFQHNGYLSSRTLEDLIRDLKTFLVERPGEFIILDFHKLDKGDGDFNFTEFSDLMLQHLGERMIPTANRYMTLGQLRQASPLQRILVAGSLPYNSGNRFFHSSIGHKWINQKVVSTTALHKYITQVMSEPMSRDRLWSLSATSFTVGGPQRILEDLDVWFDPAKTNWAKKCNIINFDFIKDSKIVLFCHAANVEKAKEKSLLTARAQTV
ncbi:hypothetical protein PHLH6_26810 [Pseudomonas sp. Seg1]|uniref:phospholipase n=1 Tax=Pseudomonas sp. Seg1 TaxID=2678259 RepID=UPI001BB42AB8|nr:phospholipase [Pseudomonas sp. Seg1]BBP70677.1 hypothetical protein PHLH6_26810 [Pseudomonas sp. Seg1]